MDVLDLGRYFGALILVMGLLGFAWLAARKYGVPGVMQGTSQKRLSVVETLMIGPRHKVYLLRRDGTDGLAPPRSVDCLVLHGDDHVGKGEVLDRHILVAEADLLQRNVELLLHGGMQ